MKRYDIEKMADEDFDRGKKNTKLTTKEGREFYELRYAERERQQQDIINAMTPPPPPSAPQAILSEQDHEYLDGAEAWGPLRWPLQIGLGLAGLAAGFLGFGFPIITLIASQIAYYLATILRNTWRINKIVFFIFLALVTAIVWFTLPFLRQLIGMG